MQKELAADIAVVGSGIVGLAHAFFAARSGANVVLFERSQNPIGASIRNFGLVWPVGQGPEKLPRALRSRMIWNSLSKEASFWMKENGSLHLAYREDEMRVLEEFQQNAQGYGYQSELLSPAEVIKHSGVINPKGLLGALWSDTEATVDPREAILKIATLLEDKYKVTQRFGHPVRSVEMPYVETATERWKVDQVLICSGSDFETLYPEVFSTSEITKCKLQMMRSTAMPRCDLGPTLCAGLTLRHYDAFKHCPSLEQLDQRYDREFPELKKYGIHILLAQNGHGELVIGDSHQYGLNPEPFDQEEINAMILEQLAQFTRIDQLQIKERWHGIYPKLSQGTEIVVSPEPNVLIINGLGGAGMTLSFGLAQETLEELGVLKISEK